MQQTFDRQFSGKIAVITGGASGMGRATVRLLAEMGAEVFSLDKAKPEKSDLRITDIECDITSEKSIKAAIKSLKLGKRPVHYLFANAGIHTIGDVVDSDWAEVEATFAVNLKGTYLTLRHFLPLMASPGGSVVVNASDQVVAGKPTSAAYGATKGALGQLTKGQALRFIDKGIRINAVCPGGVNTAMEVEWAPKYAKKYGGTASHWAKASKQSNPLKRLIEPEEVAKVVVFLMSDWTSAVTGALWAVDGGFTAG